MERVLWETLPPMHTISSSIRTALIERPVIANDIRDPNLGGCKRKSQYIARVLWEKAPALRFPTRSEPHSYDPTDNGDRERVEPSDSPSPPLRHAAPRLPPTSSPAAPPPLRRRLSRMYVGLAWLPTCIHGIDSWFHGYLRGDRSSEQFWSETNCHEAKCYLLSSYS